MPQHLFPFRKRLQKIRSQGGLFGSSIFDDTFKEEIKAMIYEIKTTASFIACGCNDLSLFLFCFCREFGNPHNPKGSGYCK